MQVKLLVVDDEQLIRELLSEYFAETEYQIRGAATMLEAVRLVESESFDVVLIDRCLYQADGIELLQLIRQLDPDVSIVMMTGRPTVDSVIDALRLGACDYVVKPFRLQELERSVISAAQAREKRLQIRQLQQRVADLEEERQRSGVATRHRLIFKNRLAEDKSGNFGFDFISESVIPDDVVTADSDDVGARSTARSRIGFADSPEEDSQDDLSRTLDPVTGR